MARLWFLLKEMREAGEVELTVQMLLKVFVLGLEVPVPVMILLEMELGSGILMEENIIQETDTGATGQVLSTVQQEQSSRDCKQKQEAKALEYTE